MKKIINNLNLDTYRFIIAFLIIGIHVFPLSSISEPLDFLFTQVFCRIGVPFFLIITGYFILTKSIENKETLIKYTKKILLIYLISMLFYLPINIYAHHFNNLGLFGILKLIFIEGTMYHLWYFPGLILGLWLTYFLIKKINKKLLIPLIILLYIIGLFGDSYYYLINNIFIINKFYEIIFKIFDYTRNGIFYMPIFLYMGYYLKIHNTKQNRKKDLLFTILFLVLMLIEGFIVYHFNLMKHTSMYIMLIPLMFYLFRLINTNNKTNKDLRYLSLLIYIIHPFFIVIIHFLSNILNLKIITQNSIINYILVSLMTLTSGVILTKIKKYIKINKLKNKKDI